jgi:hypothetical protein
MPSEAALDRSVHIVMSNFRPARKEGKELPRRQAFTVYGPLNGLITPRDLPREFWGLQRVSFGTCSDLAHPRNLDTLQDAVQAFKQGRIMAEKGPDKTNLKVVPWSKVIAQLARSGKTNRVGFTFRLGGNLVTYLDMDSGNGSSLSWRLFLGKL